MRDTALEVVEIPIGELRPYENNAKRHDNANIEAIANSIEEFGFRNPILAWEGEEGAEDVAGHGRLLAAKKLGMEKVPVIYVNDLTDEQRRMLTLADNQTTLMTGWDEAQLEAELDALRDVFSIEDFGFEHAAEELTESTEDDELVFGEENGEVPFSQYINEQSNYVVLKYRTIEAWLQAVSVLGLEDAKSWSNRKDGKQNDKIQTIGLGRVIDGEEAFRKIAENAKALGL